MQFHAGLVRYGFRLNGLKYYLEWNYVDGSWYGSWLRTREEICGMCSARQGLVAPVKDEQLDSEACRARQS